MTRSPFDLTGKTALVTGGNKGLGRAMARGLAEAGADVFIASRNEGELKESLDFILAGTGRKGGYTTVDVADRASVKKLAATATERMGKIDILVNNAGMNQPQAIDQITDDVWDRILEVNLSSCMALTRELAGGMKARKWGRVIHISSIMGQVSKDKRNAYSATKTALHGLARASAIDLGPSGVTVNCIAPGPFLTDMPLTLLSAAEQKVFSDRTALDRWGQPAELVGPVVFLASDAAAYVTGTVLYVDGGYTAK